MNQHCGAMIFANTAMTTGGGWYTVHTCSHEHG